MEVTSKAGRYELLEELGHGAMGVVYKANDPVIGRTVAVKTIRLAAGGNGVSHEEMISRFRTEARAAGSLAHPNIVTVYDAGEQDGLFYIIMEYVAGRSLQGLLDASERIPLTRALHLIQQVCGALDYAHQHRVVHRDIKPANLLLAPDDTVKVTDFGTAKILALGTVEQSQIIGTPSYMSPEQVKGKAIDGRSDLFAAGVVLYELVTGKKPFPGENITTVIYKIVNEDPIPPKQLDTSVHPGLSNVILRALAKDPAARFQNCREFQEALKSYRNFAGGGGTTVIVNNTQAEGPTITVPRPASSAPIVVERKRSHWGNIVFAILLLGIIAFAGQKVWPVIQDTWQQLRDTRDASVKPPSLPESLAPPKMEPVASPAPKTTAPAPKAPAKPAQADAAPQPAAKSPAPKSEPKPPEPKAAEPSAGEAKALEPKAEVQLNTDSRVVELKGRLDEGLVRAGLADKVQLKAEGNTLTFSGRLTPLQHRQLLRRIGDLPVWVKVQDDIEYAADTGADDLAAELNGKGLAVVNSTPPGAEVLVDGKPTGLVTPARIRLTPGRHLLTLTIAGHEPVQRTIAVGKNKIARIDVPLF